MTTVTVAIPTLNGSERLERCLKSIAMCTTLDETVRVVVRDDGSEAEELQKVKAVMERMTASIPGLTLLLDGERAGIATGWNRMGRHYADSQVVVWMNDDIEVVDDWLDVLVFSVMHNQHAGMVGLNSYLALSRLQHDKLFPDGTPEHVRRPKVDYRQARLLSGNGKLVSSHGPIFAIRKPVFDAVGGFDERYFCFYEETDMGLSLRRAGYFHYMADYPLVYHLGGATNTDKRTFDAAAVMADSRAKFFAKWGHLGTSFTEIRAAWGPAPECEEWNSQLKNWA